MKGSVSPEQKVLIEELRAQGLTLREIAKRVGCSSKSTVRRHLTSTEEKPSGRTKRSDATDARIRDLLGQGASHVTIAAELGISRSAALRWAQKLGLKSSTYFDWTPEADATLQRLILDGMSYSRAGKVMGITPGMALGRARRLQIKSNFQPAPEVAGVRKRKSRASRKKLGLPVALVGEAALQPLRSAAGPAAALLPAPVPVRRTVALARSGEGCRYPLWGDGWPTHRYCDEPCIVGKSWCPKCYAIVFTKQSWRDAA